MPAGDEKAAPANAERVKKLESIVKRQRDVVREQQASITALMEHVDELQAKVESRDAEIASLREERAVPAPVVGEGSPPAARPAEDSVRLQQELRKQEHTMQKLQDQLAAANERERALQLHIAQLQRASPPPPLLRAPAQGLTPLPCSKLP